MVDRTGHTRYRKRGLEPSAEQRACSGERAFTRSKKSPGDGDWGGEGEFVAGTLQNWLWDCRHSNQSKL